MNQGIRVKAKILVVDDEPDILLLAKQMLEMEEYEVITADDGEEALQRINDERPKLILLDIKLPKKDGYEVCKEIKSNEALKDIIVIMFTVKALDSDRERGFQVGADYYVIKPFSIKKMIDLIRKALNN